MNTARSGNRVLIVLVVLTIIAVATWAVMGGLDQILTGASDPVVVTE